MLNVDTLLVVEIKDVNDLIYFIFQVFDDIVWSFPTLYKLCFSFLFNNFNI